MPTGYAPAASFGKSLGTNGSEVIRGRTEPRQFRAAVRVSF